MMKSLSYIRKTGASINDLSDDFAKLRIQVFRAFPYLYDGTLAYEKEYIKTYSNANDAMVFAIYDDEQMVGATSCIPLKDETEEVQAPFIQAGYSIDSIFYLGESLLLPTHRGMGLGHRFFDEREAHARSFSTYHMAAFCSVNREDDHPLKPIDYRPNDIFWHKRGYQEKPELVCNMSWLDAQQSAPTNKKLTFWTKLLL